MIFGLSSGIGFGYTKTRRGSFLHVGGRVGDLGENLCPNLGVSRKVNRTNSRRRAYESLKELIAEGIPVMMWLDMAFLNYWHLPEGEHFGGHSVVVTGIDEEKGICYIADSALEELQIATLRELEEARASKFPPFPPQNRWFTFGFPAKLAPLDEAIKHAIQKAVNNLLKPPTRNEGIKGIVRFADELVKWPQEYPSGEDPYGRAYAYLEVSGTGGGNFRYLYSKFLTEAGETLDNPELIESGEICFRIGERWTKVAELIREIPSREENSIEAREILLDIAKDEENLFHKLKSNF